MFTSASHSYVEFAVDDVTVLDKGVFSEELQLEGTLHGETIDDDIPIAALVAFDGVDGDVMEFFDMVFVYFVAYSGYLMTVRHYDSDSLGRDEWASVVIVEVPHSKDSLCNMFRLRLVDLIGYTFLRAVNIYEHKSLMGKQFLVSLVGVIRKMQNLMLVCHRDGEEVVLVEELAWEE